MSRPWILVSPSSRGIGHALTRHLLRTSRLPILATARSQDVEGVRASLLRDLPSSPSLSSSSPSDRLTVVGGVDVTKEDTVEAASRRAADLFPRDSHHLHLAFAIPGVLHAEKSTAQVDAARAWESFAVNTLGPLLLMKWFTDFLPRRRTELHPDFSAPVFDANGQEQKPREGTGGERDRELILPRHAIWTTMSARVGSVTENRSGGWFSYRSSKAAVNSLTRSLNHELATRAGREGAMALAYHPGTVKTALSRDFWASVGEDGMLSPEFAAGRMVDVVTRRVGVEGGGRCWDWKGEEVPP